MTVNCSECIHNEVCGLKDKFYEMQGMCEEADNKYKEFRDKDRTKCEECSKCEQWEYCLGGAFHTWNFTDNEQNKCTYKMINCRNS